MLNTFFKKKMTVTFILKSGKEIAVKCDDIRITKSGNDLTGYDITGGTGKLFYGRLDEIAAITIEK